MLTSVILDGEDVVAFSEKSTLYAGSEIMLTQMKDNILRLIALIVQAVSRAEISVAGFATGVGAAHALQMRALKMRDLKCMIDDGSMVGYGKEELCSKWDFQRSVAFTPVQKEGNEKNSRIWPDMMMQVFI
jgi:hypothetical protein